MIAKAQTSIHVASGHLRSRPIAEAIIAAKKANPQLDIRVYLDGQEYISSWSNNEQLNEHNACVADAAGDARGTQECYDKGFYFGYTLFPRKLCILYLQAQSPGYLLREAPHYNSTHIWLSQSSSPMQH